MNTILIVDDDKLMRDLIELAIKRADPKALVISIGNPEIAMKMVKQINFSFAFVDWMLTEDINGGKILNAINNKCIKIVCTAKELTPEAQNEMLEAGAHGIFQKPLNLNQIVEVINGSKG